MIAMLGAGLVLIALITCGMLALPALARPTLPFGVRVGPQRAGDPVIVAARRSYARRTLAAAALAAVATLLAVPVAGSAGSPVVIGGIAAAALAADLLAFLWAHHTLRAAKRAEGWAAERRQAVTADTAFRTDPVRVPWLWGLPAVAVILATAAVALARYDALPATLPPFLDYHAHPATYQPATVPAALQPVLLQIGATAATAAAILVVLRARPDIDAARPKGSARRYRVYLRGIAITSLLSAACVNLTLLVAALPMWQITDTTISWRMGMYAPLAVLTAGWVIFEVKVGQGGHRLPALPGEEHEDTGLAQRDDDRHWHLAGTIYINRDDPALLIPDRIGASPWTVNLGHPIAWLLLGGLAVIVTVLLALMLLGAL